MVELAPVGLGTATLDGRVLSANEMLAETLGYRDPAALVGVSLATFHRFPERAADVLRERFTDGAIVGLELEAVRADGAELLLRINARLHEDEEGGSVVLFAVEDSTRQRASRQESRHAHKMEAVERFAAGVAHDYNNLLTTIIGEARQLLDDVPATGDSLESAQVIMGCAKRAAALTRRLLIFSRAEAAKPVVVKLNESVRAMEGALQAPLGPDVSLVLRLDPEIGPVRIDTSHVQMILSNLIANANRAMPEGGRIVVETGHVVAPADTEGLDFHPPVPPGAYISLAIGDTGTGMNPETRRRIFDPFFTTKPRGHGAGLGLATVYGLVLQASGHLAVISAPAWGTLVRVLLPVHNEPRRKAKRPARKAEPRKPSSNKKRVVVVDDEGSVLRVMGKILRRAGYVTIEVSDAFEAQDKIRQLGCDIDLLVTDVMMPKMMGTDLAHWLRDRCPCVPVLLVSGYADSAIIQEWVDADSEGFLPKPFEPDELLDRVRRRIDPAPRGPQARAEPVRDF